MLDLNTYLNKTLEVKIGEEVIHVKDLSYAMWQELGGKATTLDEQLDFVARAMSNNTEGRDFTATELVELPKPAVEAILGALIKSGSAAATDPN